MTRILSPVYLAFIRAQPCVVSGKFGARPHHTGAGQKMKGSDLDTLPILDEFHIQSPKRCNEAIERATGRKIVELVESMRAKFLNANMVRLKIRFGFRESFQETMIANGLASVKPSKNFKPLHKRVEKH